MRSWYAGLLGGLLPILLLGFLYSAIADRLLFDAAEPSPNRLAGLAALPGGNGLPFDWTLLENAADIGLPWMLSGGLTPDNVAEAVRVTAAAAVDVSSGVEERDANGVPRRGLKDAARIRAFVQGVLNADGRNQPLA